jgi:hypothetical protein
MNNLAENKEALKNTALVKIEDARKSGALIFVDEEWVAEKTPLYKPEITEMKIDKDTDCFNISGKFMPKRETVDRIGEANGVDFIAGETSSTVLEDSICGKRTVFTAYAQGRKMLPDGSYRKSSKCEYEFDPVLRAMLDFDVTELNEQTKKKQRVSQKGVAWGPTLARYILELQKMAVQRANTGARLRVIRELVGMPTAFDGKDLDKPLLFGRIVQNTDYILKTPEGRAMATAKALGVDIPALFGSKKGALESSPSQPDNSPMDTPPEDTETTTHGDAAAEAASEPDFDDPADAATEKEETEFDRLTAVLNEFLEGYREALDITTSSGKNPYKLAEEELADKAATVETRTNMIDRLRNFLKKKGYDV